MIEPKAVLATNDYHHSCSRALGGDVVTELPPFLAAAPIREKRLVPLLPQYPLPEWPINLLYPPHRYRFTIVRTSLDFCQSYLPKIVQACDLAGAPPAAGVPPLGYQAQDGKLVIVESEAETVRFIFRRYAEGCSVRLLKAELDARSIRSRLRTSASGRPRGGKSFARGALYLMLQNRIYHGEIVHKA